LLAKEYTTWNSIARSAGLRPLPQFKLAGTKLDWGEKNRKGKSDLDTNRNITAAKN